jgi:hypothetical protein
MKQAEEVDKLDGVDLVPTAVKKKVFHAEQGIIFREDVEQH